MEGGQRIPDLAIADVDVGRHLRDAPEPGLRRRRVAQDARDRGQRDSDAHHARGHRAPKVVPGECLRRRATASPLGLPLAQDLERAFDDRQRAGLADAETHNLIGKVGGTYKYYVTEPGRAVITTGLKLKELVLIPELGRALA